MRPPHEDPIQQILARLMAAAHADTRLTAEIARAEREFFFANPRALQEDPSGPVRFREWFLLERESDVLGGVPVDLMQMGDADREALADSVMGVFVVTGQNADEYVAVDLQGGESLDVAAPEGVTFAPGDVLIGRLYDGPLDVHAPSAALACQRQAGDLADAFTRDVQALELDRRMTQAEIEHLLFRGRGAEAAAPAEVAGGIPLEHLEADLEQLLESGGVDMDELTATSISTALAGSPTAGIIINPLLDQIAFDSTADIEKIQRVLVQIWQHHQDHPPTIKAASPAVPEPEAPRPAPPPPAPPKVPEGNLGAYVRDRLEAGMANNEDLDRLFAEVDAMVGPDEPADDADDGDVAVGDVRPLITEYLWERGGESAADRATLEELVVTLHQTTPPRVDLEEVTAVDLLRLFVDLYVRADVGQRTHAVGVAFAAVERFSTWSLRTQGYGLEQAITGARESFVDHAARLEAAGMALAGSGSPAPAAEVFRVASVATTAMTVEVGAKGPDTRTVQLAANAAACENTRVGDLFLGSLDVTGPDRGSFAGMVIALPAVAEDLIG